MVSTLILCRCFLTRHVNLTHLTRRCVLTHMLATLTIWQISMGQFNYSERSLISESFFRVINFFERHGALWYGGVGPGARLSREIILIYAGGRRSRFVAHRRRDMRASRDRIIARVSLFSVASVPLPAARSCVRPASAVHLWRLVGEIYANRRGRLA